MIMKCFALEVRGRGVKTIVLHPGWVKTRMGGEHACISTTESVEGLRQVILEKSGEDVLPFYDYTGNKLPW